MDRQYLFGFFNYFPAYICVLIGESTKIDAKRMKLSLFLLLGPNQ